MGVKAYKTDFMVQKKNNHIQGSPKCFKKTQGQIFSNKTTSACIKTQIHWYGIEVGMIVFH